MGSFVVNLPPMLCIWSWIDRINTFTHSREQIGSGSFIIHGLQRERMFWNEKTAIDGVWSWMIEYTWGSRFWSDAAEWGALEPWRGGCQFLDWLLTVTVTCFWFVVVCYGRSCPKRIHLSGEAVCLSKWGVTVSAAWLMRLRCLFLVA
jgi:hypothetical protein